MRATLTVASSLSGRDGAIPRRFNGAAIDSLICLTNRKIYQSQDWRFNGAAIGSSRKRWDLPNTVLKMAKLQWGRDWLIAETWAACRALGRHNEASMGPRLVNRGNRLLPPQSG